MAVEIHLMQPGDEHLLERMAPEVFDHPLDAAHLGHFLAGPERYLIVARTNGLVVGQLTAYRHVHPDRRPDSLYIDELGVSPAWQRRGIATALIGRLRALLEQSGCKVAWVATEGDNVPARSLYATVAVKSDDDVVVFEIGRPGAPTGGASRRGLPDQSAGP